MKKNVVACFYFFFFPSGIAADADHDADGADNGVCVCVVGARFEKREEASKLLRQGLTDCWIGGLGLILFFVFFLGERRD